LKQRLREESQSKVRLIKGSHIVVPRLYEDDHAYILQQPDGRVVFALPYGEAGLVGTTDIPADTPGDAVIGGEEIEYLCAAVNLYFRRQTAPADLIWSYSGVRSLYDDGAESAQSVTRDYHLELDDDPGPKLLSVFGGKITTARALAEEALDRLEMEGPKLTATSPLPGGEKLPETYVRGLETVLPSPLLLRLGRAYGARLEQVIGDGRELGRHFGAGLYEAEVRYLIKHEFARTTEDVLWRRTKLGLQMGAHEQEALRKYLGA
jgi:glycerol-3-phosphate dehydrogenase